MDYLEKVIEFHGDKLLTLKEEKTDKIFISVKHVCDGLKMSHELYRIQKNKINKDVFLKGGTNFNEYNEENRDRLDKADRLENEIRKLCILLINEYNMISWRSDQSKERIEKLYKSLKGNKITEDGKELDFKAINKLNNQNYEIIERKLNE